MEDTQYLHSEVTNLILQAFYKVYNTLGMGFNLPAYKNAMIIEMSNIGLKSESGKNISIFYNGFCIDEIKVDIIVNGKVFVVIRNDEKIEEDEIQKMFKILQSSELEVGIMLNFGKMPEHKRKYYPNDKTKLPANPFSE